MKVFLEEKFPEDVKKDLAKKGHHVRHPYPLPLSHLSRLVLICATCSFHREAAMG